MKSSASLVVKLFSMAAGFFVSIILGRKIGADGLGIIHLSQRVVSIVLVVAMIGMDNVLRKETAIAFENKAWQHVHDVVRSAGRLVLPAAALLSFATVISASHLSKAVFDKPESAVPLMLAAVVIVPDVFTRIYADFAKYGKAIF